MIATRFPSHVRLPLVPIAAVAVGALVSAVFMLIPSATLEGWIVASGIPALVPAAEPPLGQTARMALAVTAGSGSAAATWFAGLLALGTDGPVPLPRRRVRRHRDVPVLRRADAHPDAPARAPLMATRDLGAPLVETPRKPVVKPAPVEQDLPRDFDMPLSAFDPASIPEVPAEPVPLPPPLIRPQPVAAEPDDARFETFALPRPSVEPEAPPPIANPRTDATIKSLLERLERGIGRREDAADRASPPAAPSATNGGLADTLEELRRMAVRGAA